MTDLHDPIADIVRTAVLCGTDSERQINWARGSDVDSKGNNDSWRLVDSLEQDHFSWRRTHITPGYFRQPRRWSFDRFHIVWNMITDPDQNPATLEVASKILADVELPVVNRPSLMALTRRDRMADRLQGTPDVIVPKVLIVRNPNRDRIARAVDAAGFRFPAIVRRTGTQSGKVLGLFNAVDELEQIFGDRRNEYFMTEFYDLEFSDGYFRKTRYMFIGEDIVPRQHIVSDSWNIHGADFSRVTANSEALQRESDELLIGGFDALPESVRSRLVAIRKRVPLEYCGIDCCVAESGHLVVFEVNATMNVWPRHGRKDDPARLAPLERMVAATRKLLVAKSGRPEVLLVPADAAEAPV